MSPLPVVVAFCLLVLLWICWGAASTKPFCPSLTVAGGFAALAAGCEHERLPRLSCVLQSLEIPIGKGALRTELFSLLQEMNGGWSLATLLVMQIRNYAEVLFWVLFYFCLISCQHVYTVQSPSLAIVLHWLCIRGGVYHGERRVKGLLFVEAAGWGLQAAAFPRGTGKPPSSPGTASPMGQRRKQKLPTRKSHLLNPCQISPFSCWLVLREIPVLMKVGRSRATLSVIELFWICSTLRLVFGAGLLRQSPSWW